MRVSFISSALCIELFLFYKASRVRGELSEAESIVQRLLFFSSCNSSNPTTVASLGVEEKPLA
jgi:hypothetical protein